jgi:hypothetical protein
MVVKFVPNAPVMDYVLNNPAGMVGRHLANRGRMIVVAAKAQVGVSTGRLKASIHMRHSRDMRGQYVKIGSNLNYARIHHEGTKPHLIVANRAQVLRFTSGGRVVYTRAVKHPGTRPNKYLTDNLYIAVL